MKSERDKYPRISHLHVESKQTQSRISPINTESKLVVAGGGGKGGICEIGIGD